MVANMTLSEMMIPIESLYQHDFYADDISVDDSLSWEVVDHSDDDSDKFSFHSSLDNDDDVDLDAEIEEDVVVSPVVLPDSDVFMESLMEQIDLQRLYDVQPEIVVDNADEIGAGSGGYDDYVAEDDDENDDEYDLDDELVPKWVNNRFEKQRMRKLGKRAFPKKKNSKSQSLLHNRPGCIHGKHGLGLKHRLM